MKRPLTADTYRPTYWRPLTDLVYLFVAYHSTESTQKVWMKNIRMRKKKYILSFTTSTWLHTTPPSLLAGGKSKLHLDISNVTSLQTRD